jgi:hypothetical protein
MDPAALNNCSNWHLAQQDDPPVRYMAGEVFVAPKRIPDFMKRVGIESTPLLPLAFVPRFGFQRMAAQLSRFTIHPSAEPDRSIEWLLRGEEQLIRYLISPKDKSRLRWDLRALGVVSADIKQPQKRRF